MHDDDVPLQTRQVPAGGYGGFISLFEVIPNPDFPERWLSRTYQPSSAAELRKASKHTQQEGTQPEAPQQTPLLLQLISHIAVQELDGIVLAGCMANRQADDR